jgi:hypothetical protein
LQRPPCAWARSGCVYSRVRSRGRLPSPHRRPRHGAARRTQGVRPSLAPTTHAPARRHDARPSDRHATRTCTSMRRVCVGAAQVGARQCMHACMAAGALAALTVAACWRPRSEHTAAIVCAQAVWRARARARSVLHTQGSCGCMLHSQVSCAAMRAPT